LQVPYISPLLTHSTPSHRSHSSLVLLFCEFCGHVEKQLTAIQQVKNITVLGEISDSQHDAYEDVYLLGNCIVLSGKHSPTFQRSLLSPLMKETVQSCGTSVTFYLITRCNIPEDSHLHYCPLFNI